MRVTVDTAKCQAYANCVLSAPDVFDLDEENAVVQLLREHPPEELATEVEEAVRSCPVLALSLHDS